MLISDVLRAKGNAVEQIRSNEKVSTAVRKLSERRIGVLVVDDQWMKMVGIFSERDLVNAVAREGEAALSRPGFRPDVFGGHHLRSHRPGRRDAGENDSLPHPPFPVVDNGNWSVSSVSATW